MKRLCIGGKRRRTWKCKTKSKCDRLCTYYWNDNKKCRTKNTAQFSRFSVTTIIKDSLTYFNSVLIQEWFSINQRFSIFLASYSPFLSPVEEVFAVGWWKIYGQNPYNMENLLLSMELWSLAKAGSGTPEGFIPTDWQERTLPVMKSFGLTQCKDMMLRPNESLVVWSLTLLYL